MYIGGSIALLAIGAILSFAVQASISGIDLIAVGYILMVAGALGIVLSLVLDGQRRRDLPPPR
ncbi:DUF6458 family protein [Aeromicrobium sp.]|uniref:DUF6458 family protein n=1 Tax=Aeromicrobium sp. TaxID=1871063 RepID=UPI0019AB8E63|nr:DUF6458 family protein [Aeromicrobium sp.]MBC7631575.1 hypothetical protein [Aeromicrobium sp.]